MTQCADDCPSVFYSIIVRSLVGAERRLEVWSMPLSDGPLHADSCMDHL